MKTIFSRMLKRIFGGMADHNDPISLEQTGLDMMREVFRFFKSGSYKDALNYIKIAKEFFRNAGKNNPDTMLLEGLMPPPELIAIETLAELEEYIKYIKEGYDACLVICGN